VKDQETEKATKDYGCRAIDRFLPYTPPLKRRHGAVISIRNTFIKINDKLFVPGNLTV
jgi:hypothetical protein